MRGIVVIFILLLVTACTCGCTSLLPQAQPAAPVQQQAAAASQPVVQSAPQVQNGIVKDVEIIQRSFDPAILRVSPGTTVVWTNKDTVNHRVVHLPELPSDKELFHSESLSPGQSFTYVFSKAGRYEYGDPQYAGGRTSLVIVE